MQKLIIKNFGPIKDAEIDIQPFMVLIGPQASGKSTIAKLIYFFLDIPSNIWQFVVHSKKEDLNDDLLNKLARSFRERFHSFLGGVQLEADTRVEFRFDSENNLVLVRHRENPKHVDFVFSSKVWSDVAQIVVARGKEVEESIRGGVDEVVRLWKINEIDRLLAKFSMMLGIDQDPLFIPAGRGFISILGGQPALIDSRAFDFPTRAFADYALNSLSSRFHVTLEEMIREQEFTGRVTPPGFSSEAARQIGSILKGQFVRDENGPQPNH